MVKKKCAVCGTNVPMTDLVVQENVGFHCDECDKYYCPKHYKASEPFLVAAGVDAEATWYTCPNGHRTMW